MAILYNNSLFIQLNMYAERERERERDRQTDRDSPVFRNY